MIQLLPENYALALEYYKGCEAFFPLVGAVLEGRQRGVVYANAVTQPRRFYVEHAFGFAQIFGDAHPEFDTALRHYLLEAKAFSAPKARLYTPCMPSFLKEERCLPLRSFRQRFHLHPAAFKKVVDTMPPVTAARYVPLTAINIATVEQAFGLVERFWPTAEDFLQHAMAVVLWNNDAPAAICYAAAVSCGQAEIDVFTLPDYRSSGFGKMAVALFVKNCCQQNITPLWDCFTNNTGSMKLCDAMGFVPARPEYPFYTLAK